MEISEISGGSKSFDFGDSLGSKCVGTIKLIERRQQRDFSTGAGLEWDDGSPRLLAYVELETDARDSDDDDGVRALYLKGGRNFEPAEGSGASGEVALALAAKEAGTTSIDEGGKLAVAFSGRAKPTTRGYQPARLFTVQYSAPKASVAAADLFDD